MITRHQRNAIMPTKAGLLLPAPRQEEPWFGKVGEDGKSQRPDNWAPHVNSTGRIQARNNETWNLLLNKTGPHTMHGVRAHTNVTYRRSRVDPIIKVIVVSILLSVFCDNHKISKSRRKDLTAPGSWSLVHILQLYKRGFKEVKTSFTLTDDQETIYKILLTTSLWNYLKIGLANSRHQKFACLRYISFKDLRGKTVMIEDDTELWESARSI